jgi:uncharacterized surface protein with fasciclin (FAS1) repeats
MKPLFKSIACLLSLAALSTAPLVAQTTPTNDIVETAVAAGSFKTLAAALTAAGLVDTLKGEGPFTVFAPTDEAFAKLPKGTVESLLKPENKAQLTDILINHVVPGEIPLSKALEAGEGTTLQGSTVNIRFENGSVKIGDATLATADIKTTNGVIHVIDTVLIPSAPTKCAPSPGKCATSSAKTPQSEIDAESILNGEIIIRSEEDIKQLIKLQKLLSIQIEVEE